MAKRWEQGPCATTCCPARCASVSGQKPKLSAMSASIAPTNSRLNKAGRGLFLKLPDSSQRQQHFLHGRSIDASLTQDVPGQGDADLAFLDNRRAGASLPKNFALAHVARSHGHFNAGIQLLSGKNQRFAR